MKTLKNLLFLLPALLSCQLRAQPSKAQRLDSLFTSLYQTGQFSGNVLIAGNGKAIYQKSFGMANIEKQIPIDAGTRFLIASVSKQFTATAILLLKEKGKLSLDDPLSKYIPELPYPGITLRQVLNHTSGLPDYDALMNHEWDKRKFAINDDMLRMLIQYHPDVFFPPGQKYAYSNTGYALLALVIERVSGQSFTDYMEQQVFKPFGLTHTLIYNRRARPRKVDNYALGYVYQDSLKTFVLPDVDPVWKDAVWEDGIYGEDGVNTTAGDLLTWDQAVFHHQLLTAEDWAAILTPGKPAEGTSNYGFGWHLQGPIVFHSGGWPGYMAYNEQHLDNNQTIIVLRNKFSTQLRLPVADIRVILNSTDK
jgi:CubicO group peptidase (beta-lactamase class C family)